MLTIPSKIFDTAPLLKFVASPWKKWAVCLAGGSFCFFQVLQAFLLNSLNSSITQTFSLSATQISYIGVSYFIGNVCFALIAGILASHFSRRALLIIALGINLFSIGLFAAAQSIWQMVTAQLISGMVGTFPLPSSIRLAIDWFPAKKHALIISILGGALGAFGGIFSQGPIALLVEHVGWRKTLLFDDLLGISFLVLIVCFVQDAGNQPKASMAQLFKGLLPILKIIISNLQNWLSGMYIALINLSSVILGALWGNLFLVQVYHLTFYQASLFITLFFLSGMIGGPFLGGLASQVKNIKRIMQAAAVLSLIGSFLLFKKELSWTYLTTAFILLGFSTSAQALAYTHAARLNKNDLVPAAQGLVITMAMLGGLNQSIFSWLMQKNWDGKIINGQPYYSIGNYHQALYLLPLYFIIAFLSVFLFKSSPPSQSNDKR